MKGIKNIPAMTPRVVHKYLYEIGKQWQGEGTAIELGSWLGATAVPLLKGLKEAGYNKPFFAFDRWRTNISEVEKMNEQGMKGIKAEQDLKPYFIQNVTETYQNVVAVKGRIPDTLKAYDGGDIEICIFDAPKRNPVFIESIRFVLPKMIPGVSILGLMDYYFYRGKKGRKRELMKAPIDFMVQFEDHFEKLQEWPDQCSCAFFKYRKELKLN